jgi:site-specific DNA recombinase
MTKTISNDLAKRAVIYCRVSTKEQVEDGNSLVSQERLCREYATREGFEVTEVFIEKGESAKTADRAELKRMMSFCTARKGVVQAVIAYKVDRISRNIADYSYLRVKLKSAGAEIRSVTEFFEDTPAGRFMENIIANVGQFDNDVRTERCVGGMREAVREGRYVWMAPLGYDNVKLNGKSTIAQNEKGTLIREAFELIAERNQSTEAIRQFMATKGLLNKKAQPVSQSNFYKLIRNPLYKGTIKKMGIISKGSFKAIVSDELFDIVQNILKGRKNPAKNYLNENPDFPLRRFVSHPSGKRLTGYWSKGKYSKYPYYSFNQPGLTFAKNKLETKFVAFFAQFEFEQKHLNVMRDFLHKTVGRHIDNDAKEEEIIKNRIDEINDQIDKLVDIHEKGGITITMLTDRTGKFETELEHLKTILSNNKEENC